MSGADLQRLAALFGSSPFTSSQAHSQLDAGLGQRPSLRAFANALRAAVGRPVAYGPRTVALRAEGTAHGGLRRWRFEPITPPAEPDSNEDLL